MSYGFYLLWNLYSGLIVPKTAIKDKSGGHRVMHQTKILMIWRCDNRKGFCKSMAFIFLVDRNCHRSTCVLSFKLNEPILGIDLRKNGLYLTC